MKAIVLLAMAAMSCYSIDPQKPQQDAVNNSASKGFAVIELFTSEGCSSCPPADELVSQLVNEHMQDVYVLSYHVDYWNRLGWKDVFSKAAFSERQKQYAYHLSLEGVYTPQIVVNGTDEFVGSNEVGLRNSLQKNSTAKSELGIAVENKDGTIHMTYTRTGKSAALLNLAIIQPEATTDVKRGENGGKKLHHVNIVRELKTVETNDVAGSTDIQLPPELVGLSLDLVAYIQDKETFKITGAMQVHIPSAQ